MSEENKTIEVVDIQFRPGQKVYYFDPAGENYQAGDHVIIDTARGDEYGYCTGGNHLIRQAEVVSPLRPVLRKATPKDEEKAAANRVKEEKAVALCQSEIQRLELDMQLVGAECSFDGTKILFFFTADDRVDFRELVKTLAAALHTRIELRQIGVRDKAKMVGGLGICGRPFCCCSFLEEFVPVSIKMAKTQNLSLTPTKISGTCGRLMCCLKYEQEAYESLLASAPKPESFVDTPDGRGTVVDVNLLRQKVKVRMEENPDSFGIYKNEEIAILRNGKAKKTDAPIPADLAPISGGGKRRRLERIENLEEAPALEAIRFRYSEESIAEAAEEPVAAPEGHEEQKTGGRRRNRHRHRPGKATEKPAKPAETVENTKKQSQKPAESTNQPTKNDNGEEPAKKPHHYRRHYRHHRKPNKPDGNA